jgi:acyl-CoA synthetase (AMP-forming)/AMP-acid ligase II
MNLAHFLDMAAARCPEKRAVICEGHTITYGALKRRADELSAALMGLGVTKGMPIAILAANSIEYVEILFALMQLGAMAVPLNHRLTKKDIEILLKHAEAKVLFCEAAFQELVPSSAHYISHIISINRKQPLATARYEELFKTVPRAEVTPVVSAEDPAAIIYTAGTTDEPKGVLLTHENLIWNTLNYSAALGYSPQDIELAPTPLFHTSTFGRIFTYVFNAMTAILVSKFNTAGCLSIIEKERVTSITQAPTMYRMMLDARSDGTWDTGSVKRAVTGAAAMSKKTKESLKNLFPEAGFFDLYGLTEASPGISILTPDDFYRKPESVGRAMLSVEGRVAGTDDQTLAPGETGEILCRGPNIMREYYKAHRETARALRGGWLHTGDAGWIDADGFIHIAGRMKDIIISGGVNIYPGEVEAALMEHPAVQEAAVIGAADELWGEKVTAFVVLKKSATCTAQVLMDFCRERLAGFKCPRSVVLIPELPRNAAQKVMKQELQKIAGSE